MRLERGELRTRRCRSDSALRTKRLVCERTLQPHVAAVVTKRGGAEIRRAETAGGVIGKSVTLRWLSEHAGSQ
jgi:hypothetical protein